MTSTPSSRSFVHEQTYGEWVRTADTSELTTIERAELLDLLWWDVVNPNEATRLDHYVGKIVELTSQQRTFAKGAIPEGTRFKVLYRNKDTLFGVHSGFVTALKPYWVTVVRA